MLLFLVHCLSLLFKTVFLAFCCGQKFQLFQGQMEEIDTRLVEAERVKASWTPVQDLGADSLSEHMDNLKVNAVL